MKTSGALGAVGEEASLNMSGALRTVKSSVYKNIRTLMSMNYCSCAQRLYHGGTLVYREFYRCAAGSYRCAASSYRCAASSYRCAASFIGVLRVLIGVPRVL